MMKHCLALVLLTAAFFTASCGGGNSPLPTSRADAGTGTVPLYQSSAELLTLPMLKVAGNIQTDVKLQVKKDGSWALLSSGPVRAATASDSPGAALAAPGSTLDLGSGQTDATLTVARLHVAGRIFANVALRLTGKTWAFVGTPQEVKTLHLEDFKSNTAIRANESHHVILKSSPTTGVQNVPMQLSTRSYKFCMDAQAEGADSTTLLDAAGNTVFTLKAGEPCVTINAREGAYTLQHRYGGTGSARTVFMRHQENTTASAKAALRGPISVQTPRLKAMAATGSDPIATENFPGAEYWAVRSFYDSPDSINFLGVIGRSSTSHPLIGASLCSDLLTFGFTNLWLSNAFLEVKKDIFGGPYTLGVPFACTSDPVATRMGIVTSFILSGNQSLQTAFQVPGSRLDWGSAPISQAPNFTIFPSNVKFPDYLYNPSTWSQQTLTVTDSTGKNFGLNVDNGYSVMGYFNSDYFVSPSIMGLTYDHSKTAQFSVASRFFPNGLPSSVTLAVGQVALFTGPNCSGAAVLTTDRKLFPYLNMAAADVYTDFGDAPGLYEPTLLPGLATLGTSFQLGLQTSVTTYAGANYQGEARQIDQLICTSGIGANGQPPGSIKAGVSTIDMVISTDSCEYCNLAGVDFSGHDLTNVKLSHANLNGAVLSNVDLSGADLRATTLQGADLVNSNLDGANLCGAQLNGSAQVNQAATLTGAHLRNTNLANTNLDGAKLSSASFYSSGAGGSCQQTSCDSYVKSKCASAYGASVNNASFDSAYLSNVDMGTVKGVGVNFSNAALFGVSFAGADLSHNNLSSVSSFFNNTYLQGTDFSRANLKFADFTGAQFDLGSACIQANLSAGFGQFPGSKVPDSPGSASCVAGKATAAFCTESLFAASPAYPPTDCTNLCPDGSRGGTLGPQKGTCSGTASCAVKSWAGSGNSALPISSCNSDASPPPLCGSAFSSTKNQCW